MRSPPSGRVVDTAGSLHSQQCWIRSSIPAGALVFLGCVPIAGGDFHPFLSVLTLLLAVVAILTPESPLTLLSRIFKVSTLARARWRESQ